MLKERQTKTANQSPKSQEDVVLNLTITGAREQILCLLEQMDDITGFSVLKGSFIVSHTRNTPAQDKNVRFSPVYVKAGNR